jgi:hypothetical protein
MLALTEPRCWGHVYRMGDPRGDKVCAKRQGCDRYRTLQNEQFDGTVPATAVIPIAQMLCGDDETCPCFLPVEAR